ncbi:putative Quercetin 2,3-dioxygenase [Candidatus Terasakiella magnetica]|uniref:Putative Quercetin 2,3-dioxygenase n=1 Tax=Candidatus Terasakiella magnetica TaxID=1867952 RepID=A0A1C3RGM6_9PROT|nr:pirin family protein [Candidatus Terasakiella magnetica]SCA56352.1 putative Quercetin 2,3-dioxygenase [Candidatus Terasakiella magnetica]
MTQRMIDQIVSPLEVSDGAGVKIKRVIATPTLNTFDPFLLLDVFGSEEGADYIAGFPDHPHRGFETVTYMLNGKMRHRDSSGNEGLLETGGAQWMTAGRGIIHSEMPEQTEGLMKGFQLWVNLPASHKMTDPRYQDISPEDIAHKEIENVGSLKVIAGEMLGVKGPVSKIITEPVFIDLDMQADSEINLPITQGHAAFLYVFEGSIHLDGEDIETDRLVTLQDGDQLLLKAGPNGGRFILLSANPIGEPIARHGPFVMNTREEIYQAFEDFRAGRF